MGDFRSIAVIIPVYNEMAYLPRLLESLAALTSPLPFRVYFVDGGSRDGTREYLEEKLQQLPFPAVLLDNPRRVPAAALNIGIRAGNEDLLVRMDGHTAFPPDYLEKILAVFQRHPRAGATGASLRNRGRTLIGSCNALAMSSPFGMGGTPTRVGGVKETSVDTIAFPAIPRKVAEEIGEVDEELEFSEDDEYNYRIRLSGREIIYDPQLEVDYFVRETYSGLFRQMWNYGRGKVRSLAKHGKFTNYRQLIPAAFVVYVIIFLLGSWRFPILYLPGGAYLLLSLYFSVRLSPVRFPCIMISFFIMHLGYGSGYLRQLWGLLPVLFRKRRKP